MRFRVARPEDPFVLVNLNKCSSEQGPEDVKARSATLLSMINEMPVEGASKAISKC